MKYKLNSRESKTFQNEHASATWSQDSVAVGRGPTVRAYEKAQAQQCARSLCKNDARPGHQLCNECLQLRAETKRELTKLHWAAAL